MKSRRGQSSGAAVVSITGPGVAQVRGNSHGRATVTDTREAGSGSKGPGPSFLGRSRFSQFRLLTARVQRDLMRLELISGAHEGLGLARWYAGRVERDMINRRNEEIRVYGR